MTKKINVFEILNGYYTTDDFASMFQNSLYKNYGIIVETDDMLVLYDNTATYKTNDIVYVKVLGNYKVYVSLIDNNNEPLNNTTAWENTTNTIITKKELEALIALCIDIIPASLDNLWVDDDDTRSVNKLKYIIGLFMACYLGNKNGAFADGNGGKYVVSQSIDGLQASFRIPDYLLSQDNLFYANNPYGLELLSLYKKLFVSDIGETKNNMLTIHHYYKDLDF